MQQYVNAAGKVASLAVGSPDVSPGSQVFNLRQDASQDRHIDGLPFGTVGGLLARPVIQVEGDYTAVGEVLPHQSRRDARPRVRALHGVLGRRQARPPVQGRRRRRLGGEPGEQHDDRRPDRRAVASQGAADAWAARHHGGMARQGRGHRSLSRVPSDSQLARSARSAGHPAHADVHRHRPVQPRRQRRHAQPAADLRLPPGCERDAAGRGGVRHAHPLRARPPRLPWPGHRCRHAAADDVLPRGAPARWIRGRRRGRRPAHPGQSEVHLPSGARSADREGRRGVRAHRLRAGVASGLLPLEQHSRRSAAAGGQPGTAAGARRPRAPGQADAGRSRRPSG